MAESSSAGPWGEGVEITPPKLYLMEFSYDRTDLPERPFDISYTLGVHRFSLHRIGVQFGAEIAGVPDLTAKAIYRMIFTLRAGSPEAEDPEAAFATLIARMAPVAMYPFVREAFASMAQKALMPHLILPVQNIGSLWSLGEVEVPPPPEPLEEGKSEGGRKEA